MRLIALRLLVGIKVTVAVIIVDKSNTNWSDWMFQRTSSTLCSSGLLSKSDDGVGSMLDALHISPSLDALDLVSFCPVVPGS